ncbi:MAG: type II toxin-antitoxin system death-on-curing family toxin [Cyclobacteriaceae bacterium]
MILLEEVEIIHDILIERYGGTKGIRDKGALESALNRPYQTFDSKQLYPEPIDKAAAIFESLITNHPFIDGNKRTAFVLMRLMLMEHKTDIVGSENEKYNFVIKAASGELTFDQIKDWITNSIK